MKFKVYTILQQERAYIVEAETLEDAKQKLYDAFYNDSYDVPFPFDISDYGDEELTGEVQPLD